MSDLFWTGAGAGEPLVLLHGGFLDHEMWTDQIRAFAPHCRVVAPDARGHGRSPVASAPFRHTDDIAALLQRLDLGPAVLAGVSMGAATAVDTALEHPGLVRAVVVTGAGTSEPTFTDPWTVSVLTAWTGAMAAGDLDGSVEGFMSFVAGPHRRLDEVDPDVERRLRRITRTTMSKHTAGEPDWSVPVPDTWARAAGIAVPVLVVHGGLDSPDHIAMADRLAGAVRDARTVTLDGTAHYPNVERPEAYNAAVLDFLRSLPPSASAGHPPDVYR